MNSENATLQKKQTSLIGIIVVSALLAVILPFFGFYAGLFGISLALVALVGTIILLFLKEKMLGFIMLMLTLFIIGPLSTLFTVNVYFKHEFGMDVYSAIEAFSVVSDYKMQIDEAEVAGNFEAAYALRKKSYDFVQPKISSVFEYKIQQAKANGDLEYAKELESQRDDILRSLNEELQSELELLEEDLEEEPVAVEVGESEKVEEDDLGAEVE